MDFGYIPQFFLENVQTNGKKNSSKFLELCHTSKLKQVGFGWDQPRNCKKQTSWTPQSSIFLIFSAKYVNFSAKFQVLNVQIRNIFFIACPCWKICKYYVYRMLISLSTCEKEEKNEFGLNIWFTQFCCDVKFVVIYALFLPNSNSKIFRVHKKKVFSKSAPPPCIKNFRTQTTTKKFLKKFALGHDRPPPLWIFFQTEGDLFILFLSFFSSHNSPGINWRLFIHRFFSSWDNRCSITRGADLSGCLERLSKWIPKIQVQILKSRSCKTPI